MTGSGRSAPDLLSLFLSLVKFQESRTTRRSQFTAIGRTAAPRASWNRRSRHCRLDEMFLAMVLIRESDPRISHTGMRIYVSER